MFGVCNVVIDTAGGASNKAIVIPYLAKQSALSLRIELYARKNAILAQASKPAGTVGAPRADEERFAPPSGSPVAVEACRTAEGNVLDIGSEAWEQFGGIFGGDQVAAEAASYEYGLSNKEVVLAGVANSGGVAGAILLAAAGIASAMSAAGGIGSQAASAAGGFVTESLARNALGELAFVAGAGFVGLALFVWVVAVAGSCLQYGGFRARRRGTRIEVERGLLQHNAMSLDVERVQSVVVKQTFVRRLMGCCEVSLGKVSAAGPNESSGGGSASSAAAESGFVIHPFLKVDKAKDVIAGMVPEYAETPNGGTRVAPAALRRGFIRRCVLQGGGFWTAAAAAVAQLAAHLCVERLSPESADVLGVVDPVAFALYGIAATAFAFELAGAVLWFRESRFSLNRRMAAFTNGGLSKTTVVIPRAKVQFGLSRTNPLQRRAGTSTVLAVTAAGIGGTRTALIDVTQDVAEAWLEWVEPGGSDRTLPGQETS